ncbi:MAG: MYXO-CTERM sorting domain-containing protein [Polyangiaceae bacterium]
MASRRWSWTVGLVVASAMTAPPVWAADAGSDAGADAGDGGGDGGLVCPNPAPIAASFTPPAYVHAVPHQNACSAQLIADYYAQCLDAAATPQTCAIWTNMPDAAHAACEACLVTPSTASAYGPVVQTSFGGGTFLVNETNTAGCIELADPAGLACATKLQDRSDCDDTACAAQCPVSDDTSFDLWQQCLDNADQAATSCQSYYDATSCAQSEMPDGGVAQACFPTVANATFEDYYDAIAPVFCLSLAPADAGGTDAGGGSDAAGGGADASGGEDAGPVGSEPGGAMEAGVDAAGSSGGSDGGFAGADGGPVTTPVDAGGGGSDGGTGSAKSSSGCSCNTAPASEGASAALALAGLLFLARARRRKG